MAEDSHTKAPAFLGSGWRFPPTFPNGGRDVAMVEGPADVHESLQILLATRVGERVMQESYGCELSDYVFEEVDRSLINNLTNLISEAVLQHEPRILLDHVDVNRSNDIEGLLLIRLSYTIRSVNSRFNMVYPFYINEAVTGG